MNKKMKIGIIILGTIIVLGIVAYIIFKPQIELNKAVEYLKYGNYKEAYSYVETRNNEENKTIIKELITDIFCDRGSSGAKKIGEITNKSITVMKKVNMNNIDYTLDDSVNIDVQALDAYIALEDKISKDMMVDELAETYDLYFKTIKYVRENFYDVLNHINDEEFVSNLNNLGADMTKISNDCFSYADNHSFNPKTVDLYKEVKTYN